MNARLAGLAARRMLNVGVLCAAGLALWIAAGAGTASDLAQAGSVSVKGARAAAWIEGAWTAFLALVVPLLLHRAASLRTPGEVAWTSVSSARGARGSFASVVGASLAVLALTAAWTGVVALGPSRSDTTLAFAGRATGPEHALFDDEHPLVWRSAVPAGEVLHARVEVSLGISAGGGGEVVFRARRIADDSSETAQTTHGTTHVLPRGGVDVEVQSGAGVVEFELALPEDGARGFLASDDVTLWRVASPDAPALRLAAHVALALLTWTALAFGLGAWMSPLLTLGTLAAVWCAIWWSDAASCTWLPGAGIAEELALVASGRAPSAPTIMNDIVAVSCVAIGCALSSRGAEGRP